MPPIAITRRVGHRLRAVRSNSSGARTAPGFVLDGNIEPNAIASAPSTAACSARARFVVAGHAEQSVGHRAARFADVAIVAAEMHAVGPDGGGKRRAVVDDRHRTRRLHQLDERARLSLAFALVG